jgi:hypothetical protein
MRSTPAKLADLGDDIENEPKALLAESIQSDARLSARGAARAWARLDTRWTSHRNTHR